VVILPPSVLIGIASLNTTTPRNNYDSEDFWMFGVTVTMILCIQTFFLSLVRYWWVSSKRRHVVALESH